MIGPQFPDEAPDVPTADTLRQFAGLCLVAGVLIFAMSWYRHHGTPAVAAWIALGLGLAVGLPGLAFPEAIRPVFLGALAVTRPIGHVVSTVLLGAIYFGLMTPLALLFRLAGRDSLARRRPVADSYWSPKSQPTDVRRYLRQYQGHRKATPDSPSLRADHGPA